MSWGLGESLLFAAMMTVHDLKVEQKKHFLNRQPYYQEFLEKLTTDSRRLCDEISAIVQKASRIYIPDEIVDGIRYLPLYAFGLVIKRQGYISKDQSAVLKLYFENLTLPFSQNKYVSAMKSGVGLEKFDDVVSISKNYAGSFWIQFFRALYKAGTQNDYQNVMDIVTALVMRFSLLDNPHNKQSVAICTELLEATNSQLRDCLEMPTGEIDWFGCIPAHIRVEQMNELYQLLICESDITDVVTEEELSPMLNLSIAKCLCDLAMLTKRTSGEKLEMIDGALQLAKLPVGLTAEEIVKDIANKTEVGQNYLSMFRCDRELGTFWKILLTMGGQVDRRKETFEIIYHLSSVLIQAEDLWHSRYRFLGEDQIARKYMVKLIERLKKYTTTGE